MSETKRFAFDVGITFIASSINMLIAFLITVVLGRYIGADDLGLYRMTSTIYGIAMLIATVGIPAAMIKYVAEYKGDSDKNNTIVSAGVITSLFLGIAFGVFFYLASDIFAGLFNMPELSGLLKILSPVFPFAVVGGALLGFLNGLRKMKKHGMATIIQAVLMLVISAGLIYLGYGIAGAVIGIVLSSAGSCLYLFLVSREYFEITFHNYLPTTKKMLTFGSQIFAGNAINMVNYQADIVLIGYFLTATDVGYYAVAVGLSKFFWLIPSAIQMITYPATSEYWAKKDHSALQKMIDKSMKYTACVLLPVGLGVGFFAGDIISLIFGGEFIYAVLPLHILIVGTVVFGIVKAIGGAVTGIGRPDIGLKIVGISATINIVLNVLLIPVYGITGAAVATAVSLFVASLLGIYTTNIMLNLKIGLKWYAKISVLTLLTISVFIFFKHINEYLLGITLLCIYLIVIFTNFLAEEDRTYLIDLIRRD